MIYWQSAFILNFFSSQIVTIKFIIMFFLEYETIPGSHSFCCLIALEYRALMSCACMKKNSMIILLKKFQLKKMMFWWSFCILLVHQQGFCYWGMGWGGWGQGEWVPPPAKNLQIPPIDTLSSHPPTKIFIFSPPKVNCLPPIETFQGITQ